MSKYLTDSQMTVALNILGAVETGGQIYGNRRYDDFTSPYANSPSEYSCTAGAFQEYGENLRQLLIRIKQEHPGTFNTYDTIGIASDIKRPWTDSNPYAVYKNTAKANVIVAIISSTDGKKIQDARAADLIDSYLKHITRLGVTNVRAALFCAECEHLGGAKPIERIVNRARDKNSIDALYDSLMRDQRDTSNNNQIGDKIYQTRHDKCRGWIEQYISADETIGDKEDTSMAKDLWTQTAELMAAQSGYLEKASNYNLDSKTGNAGYNNYTKYARDVNSWGQPGCQGQAWCAVYQFWICVKIFGLAKALQIMGGGFYNCNSVKNHAKANKTWHSTPKLGALPIFRNGAHIGRVTKVTSTQVYTNEGNTSSAPGVVANGGAVRDKVYSRNDPDIDGYVWIDYDIKSESGSTTTAGKLNTVPKWTGEVTASELNVRSWAGTEYPQIKKWPLLKRTNRVDVCDSVRAADGSAWYYVRIAGKYYGFVHSGYIARV